MATASQVGDVVPRASIEFYDLNNQIASQLPNPPRFLLERRIDLLRQIAVSDPAAAFQISQNADLEILPDPKCPFAAKRIDTTGTLNRVIIGNKDSFSYVSKGNKFNIPLTEDLLNRFGIDGVQSAMPAHLQGLQLLDQTTGQCKPQNFITKITTGE